MKLNSWQEDVRSVVAQAMVKNEKKLKDRVFCNTSDFIDSLFASDGKSSEEDVFLRHFSTTFGGKSNKAVSAYILSHSDIWETLLNASATGFDYSMDLKENSQLFLYTSVLEESKNLMYRSSLGELDTFMYTDDMAKKFNKVFGQAKDDLAFDITVKENFKKRAYHIYKESFDKNSNEKPRNFKDFINYEYEDRLYMEHLLKEDDFKTYKKVKPFTLYSKMLTQKECEFVTTMVDDYYEQKSFGKKFYDIRDYVSTVVPVGMEESALLAFRKTALGKIGNFTMDARVRDDFRNTLLHMDEEVRFMKLETKDYFMRSAYRNGYIDKGQKMGFPAMDWDTFKETFFRTPLNSTKEQIMKAVLPATKFYEYEKYNGVKHFDYVLSYENKVGSKWELKVGEALREWDLHKHGVQRQDCAKVLNYVVDHFRKLEPMHQIKENCPVNNAESSRYLNHIFSKFLVAHELVREPKLNDNSFDKTLTPKELAVEVNKIIGERDKLKNDLGM